MRHELHALFQMRLIKLGNDFVPIASQRHGHGCIAAKMPGTSEPFLKSDGNLSPTGKLPTASFTVAKTLILHDKSDFVSL